VKLDLLENSIQQMARIVQKFGGTSVADLDRIRNVAQRVKTEVDAGHEVAVVVSAMSGTTNQLVSWASEIGRFMMRVNMIRLLRLANR
jgi:aspartokinase